jgi:pyruvate dehydrogenase E2 component (dihydrolipoyllysine-residue acetyltransferase)
MPVEIVMPRLGWDMKVGSVAEWLKHDGDDVQSGEAVCLISGDKATTELEAADSGVLRIPGDSPEPGVEVAVGTVLAYLVGPGESIERAAVARQRVVATPRARRAASAHGLDWRGLRGTGRGGRILERDVLHAASTNAVPATAPANAPLSGVRRVTAERLGESAQRVVPVTLTTDADATNLVELREQAVAEGAAPTYTDLLVKIVAVALGEHPALNASLTDAGIEQHAAVHVGLAVDTERGLVVPVVHDVVQRSVEQIAHESARVIEAARAGRTRPEDLRGATFTITNLGMYEIDAFTPVIALPQCAVLGVGRIVPRPVVVDDSVAVRKMVALSLTFDHRLVDGAPAARFLQTVKHLVERPTRWLFR